MLRILQKLSAPYRAILLLLFISEVTSAQNSPDSVLQEATLDNVIDYALVRQPAVRQAQIDEEVTNKTIKGKLADWYPQINFSSTYQRFFDLNTTVFNGNVVRLGVYNTSNTQLNATQNIFNRDVLLASSTASKVRVQARQNTSRTKIATVVNVTKAFYDVLATSQQILVSEESIVRLERSLKDAQSRYNSGVTDKTDYKRAMILLSNARATLTSNVESLKYKQEALKTLIGYPKESELPIRYDTLQMENEIYIDTLQALNYTTHIDYRVLSMQKELQDANVKYSYWAFLPTLNAFGSYILNFQNNNFQDLYGTKYPNSFAGATLVIPIFQGGKRIAKIQEQKWVRTRIDVDLENLKSSLDTEYTRALAAYKSNLANYLSLKENVALAQEVYDIIQLQYKNGVKAYLDVTIAETDLRTSRINYFNALYAVLASKMDVQRALGQINY